MDLKDLVKELNKKLGLEPPIPMDNQKGTLAELADVALELQAEDFGKGKLGRDAARELLKRDLVPDLAYLAACSCAGRKPTKTIEEPKPTKKAKAPVEKVKLPPVEEPVKKSGKKVKEPEPVPVKKGKATKVETEGKQESNEELARRLVKTGKTVKDLIEELRDRYAAKGKAKSETGLNKRAMIYWNIGLKG